MKRITAGFGVWLDWAVAIALAGAAIYELLALEQRASLTAGYVLLATLPLGLSHRFPFQIAVLVVSASSLAAMSLDRLPNSAFIATLFALFFLGANSPVRQALLGLLAAIAIPTTAAVLTRGAGAGLERLLEAAVFGGLAVGFGRAVWTAARRADAFAGEAERLKREHKMQAREAVGQERARIARELHDIIAHSVSVMGIQAAGARAVVGNDPDRAQAALLSIERTSRLTILELRRLLGLLRNGAVDGDLAPQPSLSQLDALLVDVRQAGVEAEISMNAVPEHLTPGIELAAYRIVQESLTNALRHASPHRIRVAIACRRDRLDIEVLNDSTRHGRASSEGHGLLGMRERVELYGGYLEAGPVEGGYRVSASLPLEGSSWP